MIGLGSELAYERVRERLCHFTYSRKHFKQTSYSLHKRVMIRPSIVWITGNIIWIDIISSYSACLINTDHNFISFWHASLVVSFIPQVFQEHKAVLKVNHERNERGAVDILKSQNEKVKMPLKPSCFVSWPLQINFMNTFCQILKQHFIQFNNSEQMIFSTKWIQSQICIW